MKQLLLMYSEKKEIAMDHYSLDTLGKLHIKELMQEGLHEQAVQRQNPAMRFSNRFKRNLLIILSLTAFLYWLLV